VLSADVGLLVTLARILTFDIRFNRSDMIVRNNAIFTSDRTGNILK